MMELNKCKFQSSYPYFFSNMLLVYIRIARPFITERLLMGRKKSNQTNKTLELPHRTVDVLFSVANLCEMFCLWWQIFVRCFVRGGKSL